MDPNEKPQKQHRKPYKKAFQPLFLAAFRRLGTIFHAAHAAGISRDAIHDWRKNDPSFEREFQKANLDLTDVFESSAISRAITGINKPVFFAGKKVGVTKEYSDSLLMFLLRARAPNKYRDRCQHQKEESIKQAVNSLSGEFISLIHRAIPNGCPNCQVPLEIKSRISDQLKRIQTQDEDK